VRSRSRGRRRFMALEDTKRIDNPRAATIMSHSLPLDRDSPPTIRRMRS
jgi:hypothetical protein